MSSQSNLEFDEMLFEADELIRSNKIADAVNLLEGIISEAPDYGKAYNHLGWVYETKLKDINKAEIMYKQCLAYCPDYPPVYLNLSIALSTLGKYDEVEALLTKALLVPGIDKSAIHNEFGILFELKQDYSRAIEKYKEAVRFSLSDLNVETYSKSINRCRTKREILTD
jgi:tetratricopeptide (TPR) repeat protein